ncbi:hypothetical protein E2C01_016323 [Portunus trituberculatus]|uniref:Uncharacterized protein n=1 Tax=Portunus trituberculatus TaxID=210409 RepID=A0A5B7DNU4_PORTR|nr:hypothetical protein [Portunus trituberculatus]
MVGDFYKHTGSCFFGVIFHIPKVIFHFPSFLSGKLQSRIIKAHLYSSGWEIGKLRHMDAKAPITWAGPHLIKDSPGKAKPIVGGGSSAKLINEDEGVF